MALWILHDCGASEKKWVVIDEAWNPQGLVLLDETTWKVVQKMILIGSLTNLASNIQIAPNLTTLIMRISLACSIPKCFRYFHALMDISYDEKFVFLFPDIDRFPTEICGLEKLEFLSISDSLIMSIPEEIRNLRNLKYLLLPNNSLRNKLGDTLANLSSLEVLNLYSTDRSYLGPNNSDYLDYCLKGRLRLKALGITVSSQNDFQQLAKLSAAGLSIRWLSIQGMKGLSTLPLFSPHFLGSQHVHSGLEQLAIGNAGWHALEEILIEEKHRLNVTYLKFRGIHLLKEITWKKGVDAKDVFANLRELHISYCFGLAHISWVARLPRLELLDIVHCIKLKQLVRDDDELRVQEIEEEAFGHGVSFPRLRSLTLIEIDGLTNISQHPLTFPSLEWLKVTKCAELKKLPFHSPTSCSNLREIIGSKSWWDNLEFDDEAMKTFLQPYFIE